MRVALCKSCCVLWVALLLSGQAATADPAGRVAKPQTRITQTLSLVVYKQMELAQKAFEAKDYKGAEADLDALKAKSDKLNDFEKATLWNLYATIFRSEDDNKRAVEAYAQVLRQNNLPEGLRNNALFSLAQTLFLMEDYRKSIAVMKRWFSVVQEVQPDAYVLLAQAHYQLQQYEEAKAPLVKAMAIARQRNLPWKESWLGLLRAILFDLKDYPNAAKVMEVLVAEYPQGTYFQQLSGLYGLQGEQKRQLEVMYIAYLGGYVSGGTDELNLARLCLAQDAPERAADILRSGLKHKTLEMNVENLQLLAQALSRARDTEQSVPVLIKLSQMSGLAKHYAYLGQAYSELGDWSKAAEAFNGALGAKEPGNVAGIQMQLATALFNGGKLRQAKDAFAAAAVVPAEHDAAVNWIKFINTEIQRDEALGAKAQKPERG